MPILSYTCLSLFNISKVYIGLFDIKSHLKILPSSSPVYNTLYPGSKHMAYCGISQLNKGI